MIVTICDGLLTLLLVCCMSAAVRAESRLHQILKRGVLRVGTTGDWNPMSVRDPATNTFNGIFRKSLQDAPWFPSPATWRPPN